MSSLRELLRRRGISQTQLAAALRTSDAAISRYVRGRRRIDAALASRIAVILDCEPEELTGAQPIMTDRERALIRRIRALPAEQLDAVEAYLDAVERASGGPKRKGDEDPA